MNKMPKNDSARTLTYSFLQLPYHVKICIVRELGLVSGKTPMNETDFFAKCFRKAKADKKLPELWDAVYKETEDAAAKMGSNPYKIDAGPADEDNTYEAFEDGMKVTTAALIRKAEKTGEVQVAHFSTNGWKPLANGSGRMRIENIEITITPRKHKPA
jgi:hypothetical protein